MVKGAVLITFKDSRRSLRVPHRCLVDSSSPTPTLPPSAFPSLPAPTLSRSCKNPRLRQTPFVCTVTLTLSPTHGLCPPRCATILVCTATLLYTHPHLRSHHPSPMLPLPTVMSSS